VDRLVESDRAGHWLIDGIAAGHLDGCLDVDLESSAFTNALPVRRLDLDMGDSSEAPAAYVRLATAKVERLDQLYARIENHDAGQRYDYQAPIFDFRCQISYDRASLVLDYPGIALRAR